MPEGENCPPQMPLSKNRKGPAVIRMNKYIHICHCSTLEKKEFTCFLSFPSLLSHACAVSGTAAGMPFPTLALCCNLFPRAALAAGSHYVHEQLQSSSSPELFCQDESLLSELHDMIC